MFSILGYWLFGEGILIMSTSGYIVLLFFYLTVLFKYNRKKKLLSEGHDKFCEKEMAIMLGISDKHKKELSIG